MKEKKTLYFIAILPPDSIQKEVTDFKNHFLVKYGVRQALKSPPHITLLNPYFEDSSHSVRKYLAVALKHYEDETAAAILTQFLADSHFTVRFAAFESLNSNLVLAKPYLEKMLDEQYGYPEYALNLAKDLIAKGEMSQK